MISAKKSGGNALAQVKICNLDDDILVILRPCVPVENRLLEEAMKRSINTAVRLPDIDQVEMSPIPVRFRPEPGGFPVLIPARNEQLTVGGIVRQVKAELGCEVVVIDDASTDHTAQVAYKAGATVLPLPLQMGAWGATQTGLRYALKKGYRMVVTMDADGQHHGHEIRALLKPLVTEKAAVVIGACPKRASRARRIAWSYFRLLTGLRIEDVTSGFRAYNHAAMKILASAEASLLDYQDVGVLLILRRKGLQIVEIPVTMRARTDGSSRVFSSWWVVGKYVLQTSLLSIARIGLNGVPNRSFSSVDKPK